LEGGGAGSNKLLSCSRTTLKNIAKLRPQSLDKLGQVPGMNNARTERFGEAFIEILQSL
jgi:ATP-dependent DNA helicase RecQ